MSASLLLIVAPIALLLVAATVVGVVLLVVGGRRPDPSQAAAAARRHAGAVTAVATVLGLLTLLVVGPFLAAAAAGLTAGVLTGLVPASAGLVLAGIHALGELTWPRPTGTVRRASLAPRTAADVSPTYLRRALWGWAAVLGLTLLICGVLATDGRQIARTLDGGSASSGPFPGWFYGLPLLVGTVVVVAATEGVLRLVARRPAVTDTDPAWDLALRRLSGHRVLRGGQLVLGLTTAGVLMVAGQATRNVGSNPWQEGVEVASTAHVVFGVALMVLAGVAGLVAAALALVPGTPPSLAAATGTGPTRAPASR